MSLHALIVLLQEGQGIERERATRALLDVLRGIGHLGAELRVLHDDAVQSVLLKLLEGTRPAFTDDRSVSGYLALMVRNHQLSALRRRKVKVDGELVDREAGADTLEQLVDPRTTELAETLRAGRDPELDELETKSRALLDRVFEEVLRQTAPQARAGLQATWAQLVAIHIEGRSVAEVLYEKDGVVPGAEGWVKAVNRLHTAHRRARLAAFDGAESLVRSEVLGPNEGDLVRRNLRRLFSRQQRTPDASSGRRDDDDR